MKILTVLSTACASPRTVETTVRLAREKGADVTVIFVVDYAVARRAADQLTDTGFVGDQPSRQVLQVIEEEYRRQGEARLRQAAEALRNEGLDCETMLCEGNFTEACLDALEKTGAGLAVVCSRPVSNLRRWLLGSAVDEFIGRASCPVERVEEGDDAGGKTG